MSKPHAVDAPPCPICGARYHDGAVGDEDALCSLVFHIYWMHSLDRDLHFTCWCGHPFGDSVYDILSEIKKHLFEPRTHRIRKDREGCIALALMYEAGGK